MTTAEKLVLISDLVAKLKKSNERELSVKKELNDDRITLAKVIEMRDSNAPMPADVGYLDYAEWVTALEKEITTSERSLAKIAEQYIEVEALEYYIANVQA